MQKQVNLQQLSVGTRLEGDALLNSMFTVEQFVDQGESEYLVTYNTEDQDEIEKDWQSSLNTLYVDPA